MFCRFDFAHLAEPAVRRLMDHSLGEARRLSSPHLGGTGFSRDA